MVVGVVGVVGGVAAAAAAAALLVDFPSVFGVHVAGVVAPQDEAPSQL